MAELLKIEEAATRLRIGRTKTFELVGTGELSSIKLGGRRLVPQASIEDLIQRKLTECRRDPRRECAA